MLEKMYSMAPGVFAGDKWLKLQPVGVRPCKDENPQAEACATWNIVGNLS
jgi:hypothetical protein